MGNQGWQLQWCENHWRGQFLAMASPCEILLDTTDASLAEELVALACAEAWRIEAKLSRYVPDNPLDRINRAAGQAIEVDTEIARLLDYAQTCYELSGGLFDITSGVLRQVWRFDGSDRLPTAEAVAACVQRVGWDKVAWRSPWLKMQPGMEIDLGGIGKEYAVDRTAWLLEQAADLSFVVNYGGDMQINRPKQNGQGWRVGIEDPVHPERAVRLMELQSGGVATSGDARRFLQKDGRRYGHVLNPRTGWPVEHAPRSVTVLAGHCTEAGLLATLALLHGVEAESFLRQQGVRFEVYW
jgi:thiamine biosynthesis lipoprotein